MKVHSVRDQTKMVHIAGNSIYPNSLLAEWGVDTDALPHPAQCSCASVYQGRGLHVCLSRTNAIQAPNNASNCQGWGGAEEFFCWVNCYLCFAPQKVDITL